MVGRAFSVKIDLDLHAVTCPGVWLCPSGKVALQINIFDSCIATHRLSPIFPLLYHNKFTFRKVFTGIASLSGLEKKLSEEYASAELVQWSPTANRNVVLATFETNLVELLYPVPCYRGLIAGVDVDLLMEATNHFPGILAPKIEVSTRTTVEEITDLEVHPTDAFIINPKTVKSTNQYCYHKKKQAPPTKGAIIRQKKVCHSGGSKLSTYLCRQCRRQSNDVEVVHNCQFPNEYSLPTKEYNLSTQKKQGCNCSHSSHEKSFRNYSACNDAHILDSCPICLKYKCYFAKKNSDYNISSKLGNEVNYQDPYRKYMKNRAKSSSRLNCSDLDNTHINNVSELSKTIHSLDLENGMKNFGEMDSKKSCCKHVSPSRHKNSYMCQSSSAPSLKEDPTKSILLAKMKQLEKTKQRLNYACCQDRELDDASLYDIQDDGVKKGFYTNLGKFYKRMYKQAKKRANDLDKTI